MKTLIGSVVALCAVACSHTPQSHPIAQLEGREHVVVRAEAGHLWWAHRTWTEPHELCPLPSQGPVENLTVRREAGRFAVSFDQGGTSWNGTFGELDSTMLAESDR
jgi:hypothetical protein